MTRSSYRLPDQSALHREQIAHPSLDIAALLFVILCLAGVFGLLIASYYVMLWLFG